MPWRHAAGLTFALACAAASAQPFNGPESPTYTVRPGDTLWDISRQHFQSPLRWPEVQRDNGVRLPERLLPGQIIKLPSAPGLARVADLAGVAWIKRGTQDQQALALGAAIRPGDVLVTERNAFLSLALADGSRVVMPSSSAMRVIAADGQLVRLELLHGRIESHVEKQNTRQFEIRTRQLGLGVRGTHFRVRDEDGVSTGEVLTGAVSVQPSRGGGAAVLLANAQGARLDGPQALQVRPLLPAPRRQEVSAIGVVEALPVPGATGYRLQLARDERFLQLAHEDQAQAPRFVLPSTLEPSFYHLRLTAFDAQRIEGMPGDDALYLRSAGPAEVATARIDADGRVDIRWPAQPGQRYVFELARTPDFNPVLASEPEVRGAGVMLDPLALAGRYYWRARAVGTASSPDESANFSGSFDAPAR